MNDATLRINDFLYDLSEFLDQESYPDFLGCCHEGFRYCVRAYSPELGKDMVWLDHDKASMANMTGMIAQHVRMGGTFTRQVGPARLRELGPGEYEAQAKFVVTHTDPAGRSLLFACGTYRDVLADGERLLLKQRDVRLQTRSLGAGIHVPL